MPSWWRAVHGCEPPPQWGLYRDKITQGLQGAAAVVAPTRAFLEEVSTLYAPAAPCRVICNGRWQKERAGGSHRLPLIFAAGRLWDRARNLPMLDEVAREVPWRIVAAGSTDGADGTTPAPRYLECVGPLSPIEMAGWMRQASIFVHPALYEPFGLTVLEAAAAGCALVLADTPTLRELWEGAATFVDPRAAPAWQAVLQRLIRAPEHLAEQACNAQQRAREFTAARMAEDYAQLYRQLLAERPDNSLERPAAA